MNVLNSAYVDFEKSRQRVHTPRVQFQSSYETNSNHLKDAISKGIAFLRIRSAMGLEAIMAENN